MKGQSLAIIAIIALGLWAWSKQAKAAITAPTGGAGAITKVVPSSAATMMAQGVSATQAQTLSKIAAISATGAVAAGDAEAGKALSAAVRDSKELGLTPGSVIGQPGTMGIYVDASGYAHPTFVTAEMLAHATPVKAPTPVSAPTPAPTPEYFVPVAAPEYVAPAVLAPVSYEPVLTPVQQAVADTIASGLGYSAGESPPAVEAAVASGQTDLSQIDWYW